MNKFITPDEMVRAVLTSIANSEKECGLEPGALLEALRVEWNRRIEADEFMRGDHWTPEQIEKMKLRGDDAYVVNRIDK